jgi:hypothetical protein
MLRVLRVVPIHQAMLTLLGQSGLQRLPAKWARRGRAERLWSARVRNPDLRPSRGSACQRFDLPHRHQILAPHNQRANPREILVRQRRKLRDNHAALRALDATIWPLGQMTSEFLRGVGLFAARLHILPNALGETRLWLARRVRSSRRDSHRRCLWRLVRLRFHFHQK